MKLKKIEILLEDLERKRYWVDLLDCYKIIDTFIDIYGVKYTNFSVEDELFYMVEKIKEYYKKSIVEKNDF
jgi:hypothetical protein